MQFSLRGWRAVCAAVVAFAIAGIGSVSAQDLASFEKRLTVHTLPNGYTFLILERPGAPGLFVRHACRRRGRPRRCPASRGWRTCSSTWRSRARRGSARRTSPRRRSRSRNSRPPTGLRAGPRSRETRPGRSGPAAEGVQGEGSGRPGIRGRQRLRRGASREGGVGLNASTSAEATTYYYSLPTNKFELFAYLESERFIHPVFREFYKERDVVMEERRSGPRASPSAR